MIIIIVLKNTEKFRWGNSFLSVFWFFLQIINPNFISLILFSNIERLVKKFYVWYLSMIFLSWYNCETCPSFRLKYKRGSSIIHIWSVSDVYSNNRSETHNRFSSESPDTSDSIWICRLLRTHIRLSLFVCLFVFPLIFTLYNFSWGTSGKSVQMLGNIWRI